LSRLTPSNQHISRTHLASIHSKQHTSDLPQIIYALNAQRIALAPFIVDHLGDGLGRCAHNFTPLNNIPQASPSNIYFPTLTATKKIILTMVAYLSMHN
jgi:hypothetical protein